MTRWRNFLWLTRQAADTLVVIWPVTACLAVWLVMGIKSAVTQPRSRPQGGWLLQLVPITIPLLLLVLGAVFVCDYCNTAEHHTVRDHWAGRAVDALMLVHFAGALWLVRIAWLNASSRVLSTALQMSVLWCSWWAGFLASMSISGDWI